MTCRHTGNDPSCSSHKDYRRPYEPPRPTEPKTPDASNYTIEDIARVGMHLVLKVRYPNCATCSYEGNKVLVFLNVTEVQVLRWRKIDPHFRDPKKSVGPTEAPGPAARFPASAEGWADALAYARSKAKDD